MDCSKELYGGSQRSSLHLVTAHSAGQKLRCRSKGDLLKAACWVVIQCSIYALTLQRTEKPCIVLHGPMRQAMTEISVKEK